MHYLFFQFLSQHLKNLQTIVRSNDSLFIASVRLALLDKFGKVARLPANIRQLLKS